MGSFFVNKSTKSPGEGGKPKKSRMFRAGGQNSKENIRRYVDEPSAKFHNTKYASQINVQFATDSTPMFTWGIRDVRVLLKDPDDVSFSRWSLLAEVWNSSLDQGLVPASRNIRSALCIDGAAALAGIGTLCIRLSVTFGNI